MDESYLRGNLLRNPHVFQAPALPHPHGRAESPASFQLAHHPLCSKKLALLSVFQFFANFRRRFARLSHGPNWETDRAHLRMPAAAVTFADAREIMTQWLPNPWIRAHRDLRAEARCRNRDRVGRIGEQVIWNEFVVAFYSKLDQIEIDHAVIAGSRSANDVDGA